MQDKNQPKAKYRKYIVHTLVAGALMMSFATINHVHSYLASHLKRNQSVKRVLTKKELEPEDTGPGPGKESDTGSTIPSASQPQSPSQKSNINLVKPDTGVTMEKTKIDINFIKEVEGSVLKGYVPLATTTKSGVTVASGVDLGQLDKAELESLPVKQDLKNKLKPYVGLKRLQAKAFVEAHPLTITNDEMAQLNGIVANKILQPLAACYRQATGKLFTSLPAAAQTALFSFAYQHGPYFMYKASAKPFWNYFIEGNWAKASATLRSSKMYASRRQQEAQLLASLA